VTLAIVGFLGSDVRAANKIPFLSDILYRLPGQLVQFSTGSVNLNEVGGVLTWITPLLFALTAIVLWHGKQLAKAVGKWQRWVLLILVVGSTLVATATLVLAQSRSALLGTAVGIFFLVLVALRRRLWALVAVVIVGGVVGVLLLRRLGVDRLLVGGAGGDGSGVALNSLAGRQEIWSRALYGLQDFPLTGMGMNTFRDVIHILYPLFLVGSETDLGHAHNHLLQVGLDLGIPGLICYLALWLGMAWMLWQSWRLNTSPWSRGVIAGCAASLIAYFIYGMTDAISLGARPGFLFWMLLGIIGGMHYRLLIENKKEPASSVDPTGRISD
jgi:putative inorganic carbon (HCO3(-)) transporter